ncbi:Peptidase A1 domain-containing protein [Mycena chlorophos]|uniref:Peptidase A1 domain-containing protein n=1 Tax=Mycena chlorophos TaxID=658473 RepID=A0A8H6SV88_MYCCL|nr:Peptidase A1 domain-containing protein [Mycena chlorophos]
MPAAQLALLSLTFVSFFVPFTSAAPFVPPSRSGNVISLPLLRSEKRTGQQRRGTLTGAAGLGDFYDVTYSVSVNLGGRDTPVVLDTGSADLWVVSDACTNCDTTLSLFPQSTVTESGLDIDLQYGDSSTSTQASGIVGSDTLEFAGISVPGQFFGAINFTTTSVLQSDCAGIFGLGFPLNSVIWNEIFAAEFGSNSASRRDLAPRSNAPIRFFPDLNRFITPSRKRATAAQLTAAVFDSWPTAGPALTRMAATGVLAAPMFTITLQRDTVDVGGNEGLITLGELPAGYAASELTWNNLRTYPDVLTPPPNAPNEVYPLAWEIFVDDVYLDGVALPRSNLSSPTIQLSALVDTGNSAIRGPADVINVINSRMGGSTFACSTPHTLAFKIGGQMFAVDPRDLVVQASEGEVTDCNANLFPTDQPQVGTGYQYSWSLGDPFIKNVVAAFYYGNMTYPSVDPPRIGLLSTVASNAGALLGSAVQSAANNGGNFVSTFQAAPTGTSAAKVQGNLGGSTAGSTGSAGRVGTHWLWSVMVPVVSLVMSRL